MGLLLSILPHLVSVYDYTWQLDRDLCTTDGAYSLKNAKAERNTITFQVGLVPIIRFDQYS